MKRMLFFLIMFLTNFSFGQDLSIIWAEYMEASNNNAPELVAMTIDSVGNSYYTGNTKYVNHFDYDPTSGTNSISHDYHDVFVIKMASDGSFLWAKTFGSIDENVASDIAVDDSGNVHILGKFEGTTDFNPGLGVDNYTSTVGADQFILKLDGLGNYIWTSIFESNFTSSSARLTVDSEFNVLITGTLASIVDFDPSTSIYTLAPPIGDPVEQFITKLDNNGNFLWAKSIPGAARPQKGITTDALDNIYITGAFNDTADFDPGPGVVQEITSSTYYHDYYVLKLDTDGNYLWHYTAGGYHHDFGETITVDDNFNVYVGGHFVGPVNFGTSADPDTLYEVGSSFIQKLNPSGIPIWTRALDVKNTIGIVIDTEGDCYIGGDYGGPNTDFDPGPGVFNHTGNPDEDVYILKLDSAGLFEWVEVAQGLYKQTCIGLEIDSDQNIYLSGNFNGTIDVSLGEGTTIYGAGNTYYRTYMAKYHQCTHSTSTEVVEACNSYVWPITGNTYNTSNQYAITQTDIYGCDSTLFLDLTIINNDYSVNNTGYTLTANQTGASYQWLSCEDSLLIPNETNQTFSPTTNGDYAVIVTNNGCTDTSTCYSVIGLGITKNGFNENVLIYPNPTDANFTIDLGESHLYTKVTIIDVLGKIIQLNTYNNSQTLTINLDAPSGIYTVIIESGNNRSIQKLHKK